MERVRGIEPLSTAWKAIIINHYTIPAVFDCNKLYHMPRDFQGYLICWRFLAYTEYDIPYTNYYA